MARVERALIAYAVLKNQLESADLYEGLMIFFRPITSSLANETFIPSEFAEHLANRYGLNVPVLVIETLAEKMTKAGLLFKQAESNGAATYKYLPSDLTTTNVSLPKITDLLSKFKSFAKGQSKEFNSLEDDAIENALFDRLLNIETLEILSRRDGQLTVKKTANTLTKQKPIDSIGDRQTLQIHLDYVVSRYILDLLENDKEGFDLLSDIASANLAAETLLTYREPPKKGETFDELEIYLDSPLCLDILGVNVGKEEYGAQLSRELKNAGCRVNIFLHSITEIERILEARKQSYLSGVNTLGRNQVDPPKIQSIVNALAGHSEQVLTEQFGFNVIDSAAAIPAGRRSTVGAEQEKIIREQLVGWRNEEGREVDVSTCCDLIRMRSAIDIQTRIIKSGVVLATRNSVLASAANTAWKSWLKDKNKGSIDRIKAAAPLAILDKHLVGLLWITQGGAVGELGRIHLIANCAAAVSTKKDVITKVYNTLLDTSEESAQIFAAIINDQRAERTLMNSTFGDPDLISNENVLPLLEKVRLATAQEIETKKNEEISELKSSYQANIAQLTLERDNANAEKNAAITEASLATKIENERKESLLFKAFRWAIRAYTTSIVIINVILIFICYLLQKYIEANYVPPSTPSTSLEIVISYIISFLIFLAGSLILTWDIPEILGGKIRDKISTYVLKFFASRYEVEALMPYYSYNFKEKRIARAKN